MCISVKDTGHGIASDELDHIFERYYQANSPYQASGSGIGLALVKSLVELHEATLDVESKIEVGTTFTLRLDVDNNYPNALHGNKPAEEHHEEEEERDEKPILLVVEDDIDICDYIAQSLEDTYTVITAHNGAKGLEMTRQYIPNIIVSDIMMPIMDGIEMCRIIKDDINTCHIPVILLTAKDSLKDKEEGYSSGADSYLTKPFSAKLLRSRIENILEGRKKIANKLMANSATPQPDGNKAAEGLSALDNEFLNKVTEIIENNIEMEKMDIAFIAGEMCMSHSTLYRKVKAVADMSVNEFIRKIKMRRATQLLLEEKHTVSEISYMTGFSSVAYFRQCFKSEFGISPSEYVRRNGRQE